MKIQVINVETSDIIELEGHEAPILGLSLDPKDEFVASSSADGTIRVWSILKKQSIHVWNDVVPKCNSFFTARSYGLPSFHCKDGSYLAYPHNKTVVIVERKHWKESFQLTCTSLKADLTICKYSLCGTRLAAASTYGEIIVWDVNTKELIGYVEHEQNAKITGLVWSLKKSDEIAYCDSLGQLGCIEVTGFEKTVDESITPLAYSNDEDNLLVENKIDDDDDDDNVISLDKIKASVDIEDDLKSISSATSVKQSNVKNYVPEVNLQPPFQPGSSPDHLLSRFMAWNDTGMIRCFTSEDGEESSIEVEFHDTTIHHSMHINNYLGHKIAALSPYALALCCPPSDDMPSKLVVVALQGWGSGNKEWTLDFPENEEALCVAAGNNFVAVATSKRNLRIYMIGGTQREILALPGPVVSMNAFESSLLIAYHYSIGFSEDQCMKLLWIKIRGFNVHTQTINIPLSSASNLMWLGFSDLGSPAILDADDIIKMYDKKIAMWRVVSDMNRQVKGKMNHYFLIGINEEQRLVRCILCKGSYYPPTTPKPIISEVPLSPPFCEPDADKTALEMKLWQISSNETDQNTAVLGLIASACRRNADYCAVQLCEEIATPKVIDLAITYAKKMSRIALAEKLESIADLKEQAAEKDIENVDKDITENSNKEMDDYIENGFDCEDIVTPTFDTKKSEMEIRPLSMSNSLIVRRSNPFIKSGKSPLAKGLEGLSTAPQKPIKQATPKPLPTKSIVKNTRSKESFVNWYAKQKKSLQEEFPHLNSSDLTKEALQRYKDEVAAPCSQTDEVLEGKKRKASPELKLENQPKRSVSSALSAFSYLGEN
ncbi:WD repeat and HMG-box DNA-binding protein 1 isoform X2 [Prorops nasuta]